MSYGQYGGGYAPPTGAPPGYGGGGGYGAGGQPGGFAPRRAAGPPPGVDPQLWNWFAAVDSDGSGQISAHELQKALINGDWTPFDLDTVKMLMTIFFAGLWKYVKDWQNVYRHFDRDRSGTIDVRELRDALTQFGYNLSPRLLDLIERKYGASFISRLLRSTNAHCATPWG
ncbi:hypothetical protein EVJ58_g7360 [Rhodofomes roseus]|uniref:EF-hand domain-containing protein n=1 Tax=Rhodofomes roseus TaxID=34475 RepID=A0A4Y9Y621_9APHY|nr:hypothetical protein EVJ58_g7360 [Rhodofomes roseus]